MSSSLSRKGSIMSMRTLLSLLFVISSSMLASPSEAQAGVSKRAAAAKRIAFVGKRGQQRARGCSLHGHEHVISAGIAHFTSRGPCLRRLRGGTVQVWRPATTRIEYRKVCGAPTFRTVKRYRTIRRCGIRVRVPYFETIKIPGRMRKVAKRVHVPGAWVLRKPTCRTRYGSQFSFLQYPRN